MIELIDLCIKFGTHSIDGDICQKYIETPIQYTFIVDDSILSAIGINIDHATFIEGINIIKEISSSIDVDMNIAVIFKRLAAAALYTVNNSVDANIISVACRFLLQLCKLPGATVYGVSNTNLVANIGNTLLKIISDESKSPIVHIPKVSKSSNNDVEEIVAKGSRQSKRIAGSSQIDVNNDVEEDEYEVIGMTQTQNDGNESIGSQTQNETGKYKRVINTRITQKSLNELLIDLRDALDLFSKRTEDHPLECFTEALAAMAFLSVISPSFTSYQEYILNTIIELASHSTKCLMAVYRSLMPLLTLSGRDNRVPDNSKMRSNAHRISLRIISGIIKKNDISENDQNLITRLEGEEGLSLPIALTCVIGALQRMTLSVPDRAPIRATVLTSIVEILTALQKKYEVTQLQPIQLAVNHFFSFLSKLARSKKVGYRAYCLEIAASLISKEWIWSLPGDNCAGPKSLISLIVSRCDDVAPTVRNRAINSFCDLLENLSELSPRPMCEYLLQLALGVEIQIAGVSNNVNLLDIVRNRCTDEKPLVRAKAIQIYGLIFATKWPKHVYDSTANDDVAIEFITMHMSEEDINVFVEGCNDMSLAVRKQAVFSITNLLQARPGDEMLHEAWVLGALPLASDCESTVQNRLGQCVFDLLISRVVETASTTTGIAAWNICVKIAAMGRNKLLRSAIGNAYRQGLFKADASVFSIKKVVKAVKGACCTELDINDANGEIISRGAWVLLEALIGHEPSANETNIITDSFKHDKGSADFVVECFKAKREKADGPNLSEDDVRMLRVLTKLVNSLSPEDVEYVKNELFKILLSMECNSSGLSVIIPLMFSLTNPTFAPSSNPKDEYSNVIAWTNPLLSIAHTIIHSYIWGKSVEGQESFSKQITSNLSSKVKTILNSNSATVDTIEHRNLVTTALFMIGELTMLGFSIAEDETNRASQVSYVISDVSKSFKLVVSETLIDLIHLLMSLELPGEVENTEVVRAHAFLALGKLCLRDKTRAREVINVFLRELHENSSTSHAAVRSNSLLVLGDLCVRYTNLIDRHVGAMAACLQDKNPMVRRHALILLTQLILQDFLKWRGMLLFRFLATAADNDSDMSEFAKTLLKNTLRSKYPDFFAHHFAECVIVFNGYVDHPTYVAAASSGSEGGSCPVTMEGVELEGRNRRSARLKLYAMMMEDFTEEQKIAVSAKLVQDIVGHFVDAASSRKGESVVSNGMEEALEDALIILQSPLLKVGRKNNENGDEEVDELEGEDESGKSALAKAKSKVLAKLSRQHLVSNILPVVMSLKAVLEANRSPLQGSVMEYLVYLIKNNRNEVNQVLATDPTLKAEIEYDLKIFEKAKEEKAAKKVAQAVIDDAAAEFNVEINFKNQEENMRRLSIGLNSALKTAKKSAVKMAMSSSILGSPMVQSALRNNNILASPMLKSVLRSTKAQGKVYSRTPKESMKQIGLEANSDDLADRLLGGESNDNNYPKDDEEIQPLSKNWRRRSWSVRVQLETELDDSLKDNDDENINNNVVDNNDDEPSDSPDKKRSTVTTKDDSTGVAVKQRRAQRGVGVPSSLLALGAKN